MTTKRKQILKAIALAGTATMDDLVMATGLVRKNLHDNVKVAMNEDLIERIRDDVTGQPAYKLTAKGRKWLENDKDDKPAKPAVAPQERKQESVTQAGSGANNPGSCASESIVDGGSERTDTSPEGTTATEPPKLDESPAEARSGERTALDIAIRSHNLVAEICRVSGFGDTANMDDLPVFIAGMKASADLCNETWSELNAAKETISRLAMQRGAWREMAEKYACETPIDLAGYICELIQSNDLWSASSDRQQARADEAERGLESILSANRKFCGYVAELVEGAQYPVNLYECQKIIDDLLASTLETIAEKCARITSLEANRSLPLETMSTATTEESSVDQTADMVNHPPHYQGKVECIDAIESALGPEGFAAYCRGNAIKYSFRAGKKGDAKQDLAKASWYLGRIAA